MENQARRLSGHPISDSNPTLTDKGTTAMLWGLVAILIMFWVLGNVMAYTAGGLLHLLIVAAIIVSVFNLVRGGSEAI